MSGESVSTAQAGSSMLAASRLDIPPRPPPKNIIRKPSPIITTNNNDANTNTTTNNNNNNVTAASAPPKKDTVPHVVRVTFLGVAGLLAKPPHPYDDDDIGQENTKQKKRGSNNNETSPAINHPSLLFPLPTHLKVVSSVARSRTARGIPSGMSKCLTNSNSKSQKRKESSIHGEAIIVETQQLPVVKQQSIEQDENKSISGASKGSSNTRRAGDISPPSQQLLRTRSSGTHSSQHRGSSAANKVMGGPSELEGDQEQHEGGVDGIEVIRPFSPAEGRQNPQIIDDQPERFVAVWEDNVKKTEKEKQTAANNKLQYVNLTNSLAFEAELRPSSSTLTIKTDHEQRASTPLASRMYAPKSFTLAVGLVPDFDDTTPSSSSSRSPSKFAIPVGFADLVINGDETLDGKRKQIDLPLSCLSNFIGLEQQGVPGNYPFPLIELTAEGLIATGNNDDSKTVVDESQANNAEGSETTPGKRKRKGLVKRMFSRKQQSAASSDTAPSVDIYDGKPQSIYHLERPPNAKERNLFLDRYGVDPSGDAVIRIALEVFPRGSELEKIFKQKNKLRKRAQAAAGATTAAASTSATKINEKSRSNAIGKKSELNGGKKSTSSSASVGSQSLGSRRSLIDDEDGDDSDCDSIFSQSFFTLDSNASQTTWDESTMFTEGLSTFDTGDGSSYLTGFTAEYEMAKARKETKSSISKQTTGNMFMNLFDCTGPTSACGGVTSPVATSYPSIDVVASAVASMSMEEDVLDVVASAVASMSMEEDDNDKATVASMDTKKSTSSNKVKGKQNLKIDTSTPKSRSSVKTSAMEEKSPLATLVQANDDIDNLIGKVDKRQRSNAQQVETEVGQEFTLAEHQSPFDERRR